MNVADLSSLNNYLASNNIEIKEDALNRMPDRRLFIVQESKDIKKIAQFVATLPFIEKVYRNYPPALPAF